jgi:hypothetical protein
MPNASALIGHHSAHSRPVPPWRMQIVATFRREATGPSNQFIRPRLATSPASGGPVVAFPTRSESPTPVLLDVSGNPAPGITPGYSPGVSNYVIAQYNADGNPVWSSSLAPAVNTFSAIADVSSAEWVTCCT